MNKKEKLLTAKEVTACKNIALQGDIYGKRAKALLALNEEAIQVNAGEQAGLNKQQVIYWLRVFRKKRIDAFPKVEETIEKMVEEKGQETEKIETVKKIKKNKKKSKKKDKKEKDKKVKDKKKDKKSKKKKDKKKSKKKEKDKKKK